MEIKIGDSVFRIGSDKDYTTGRTGYVEEIDGDKYRVRWILEKNGGSVNHKNPNKGIRTWVDKRFLQVSQASAQTRADA